MTLALPHISDLAEIAAALDETVPALAALVAADRTIPVRLEAEGAQQLSLRPSVILTYSCAVVTENAFCCTKNCHRV